MKKLHNFCICAIKIIALMLTTAMLCLLVTSKAFMAQNQKEIVAFVSHTKWYYILLPISVVCFVAVKKIAEKIPEKILYICMALVYVAFGIFLILNVPDTIRADQKIVHRIAMQINAGDYSSIFTGEHLSSYPNNMGIVSLFRILTQISGNVKIIFVFNLLCVLITNWLLYKLADLLFDGNRTVNIYTLICSFVFLPHLFYILFAYGNVPGFTAVVAFVYFMAKYSKGEQKPLQKNIYLTAALIMASVAVLLRNNYMIAVIAVVIVCAVKLLHNKSLASLICVVLLAATIVLPQKAIVAYYEKAADTEVNPIPTSLFVAMGMQESKRAPGWFNGYNVDMFEEMEFDAEKANETAVNDIKERLQYFAENPSYAYNFYKQKIVSTWCEATCQSIWIGPIEKEDQHVEQPILNNLYTDGILLHIYDLFCSLVIFNIMFFTVVFQIKNFKNKDINVWTLFPLLFLIGGFMFHLMWETKSQYIFIYYLCLVPLAASGIKTVADGFYKITEKGFNR